MQTDGMSSFFLSREAVASYENCCEVKFIERKLAHRFTDIRASVCDTFKAFQVSRGSREDLHIEPGFPINEFSLGRHAQLNANRKAHRITDPSKGKSQGHPLRDRFAPV